MVTTEQKADKILEGVFDNDCSPINAFELIDRILFRYEATNIAIHKICEIMIKKLRGKQ